MAAVFATQAPARAGTGTRPRPVSRARRDTGGPAVSVVIPAYRAAGTIARAVQSVVDQTMPAREILVVDDGSPDGPELAAALAPFGDRVTLIGKRNGGASSARNAGIERATGSLIGFLDADDYWEPTKLQRQLAVLDAHAEVGMIASHLYVSEPDQARRTPDPAIDARLFDRVLELSGTEAFHAAGMFWTGTILVRREVLGDARFDESLSTAEDRDLWMRLLLRTPSYLIGEPLATYVLVPGSLSRSSVDRDCKNMITIVDRYREELGPTEHARWKADVHRRWSTRLLAQGNGRAAIAPAMIRLLHDRSATALWTVVKSAAVGARQLVGAADNHEPATVPSPPPNLRVTVVRDANGFHALAREWNQLHQRSRADVIVLTFEWMSSWWDEFGKDRELRILVARDGDRVVGIAPLSWRRLRERGVPIRRIELLASGEEEFDEIHSEYLDFLIEEGREDAVVAAFWHHLHARPDWDQLQLESIVATSPLIPALRVAARKTSRVELVETPRVPAVIVPLPGDLAAFHAMQSKKMREDLRRHRRMLEKVGPVRMRRAESVDELREMFSTFVRLHQQLWQARGKPGCFASPRFSRFHRQVSERLFARGLCDLWLLEVDGRAVAARYSFHLGQRMFEYQSGLDPGFEPKISTGVQAAYYCIEDAVARGFREYDLGEGQQPYKLRWTHEVRPTLDLLITRDTAAARARAAVAVGEAQLRAFKRTWERRRTPR